MRHENWSGRLDAVLAQHCTEFEWGSFDCCTFAADAVRAVMDEDPMIDLRGTYTSKGEAVELLRQLGGLEKALSAMFKEIAVSFASRGDLVLYKDEDSRRALAVCAGGTFVMPGKGGIVHRNMALATKAWRVG